MFNQWKKQIKDVHEKHTYYLIRSRDKTLSPSKRKFAAKRLKQLEKVEMNLERKMN